MSPRRLYRQGDVILEEVDYMDQSYLEKYGELLSNNLEVSGENGHKHLLNARVYRCGALYIVVDRPSTMVHEQHPPLWIEPGIYTLRYVNDWLLRESRPFD